MKTCHVSAQTQHVMLRVNHEASACVSYLHILMIDICQLQHEFTLSMLSTESMFHS
jgi:hypothetical protein